MKTLINAVAMTLAVCSLAAGSLAAQSTTPTPVTTSPVSSSVVHACYLPGTGTLWVIDLPGLETDCLGAKKNGKDDGTPIAWNQTGPKGDTGPAGESVTSSALAIGDAVCPNGGSKFSVGTAVTYACNGKDGTSPIVNVSVSAAPNSVVQRDASGGIQVGATGLQMSDGSSLKSLNDVTSVAAKKFGDATVDFTAANLHTSSVMFADGTKQTTAGAAAATGVVDPTPNSIVLRDASAGVHVGSNGVVFNDATQMRSFNDVLTVAAGKFGSSTDDFTAHNLTVSNAVVFPDGSHQTTAAGAASGVVAATPNSIVERDATGAVNVGTGGVAFSDGSRITTGGGFALANGDATRDFTARNLTATSAVVFPDGTRQTTAAGAATGVVAATPNSLVERDGSGGVNVGSNGVMFSDGSRINTGNGFALRNGNTTSDFSANVLNVSNKIAFSDGTSISSGGTTAATANTLVQRDGTGAVTATTFFGTLVQPSDVNLKANFAPVDAESVLDQVARMPITEWNYRADPGVRHVGPMAQDFRAAFGLGINDKSISTIDEGGVSLAAIQALAKRTDDLTTENRELRSALNELTARLTALESAKKP